MTTGATILTLRHTLAELSARKAAIQAAVAPLFQIEVKYTRPMFDYMVAESSYFDRADDGFEKEEEMIGTIRPFLDGIVLGSLVPEVVGSNIVSHFTSIQKLAAPSAPSDLGSGMPVLDGFNAEEVGFLLDGYTRRITSSTTDLRNIHTHWRYLDNTRRMLPRFVKSQCLGLFGRPDWETDLVYSESDFRQYRDDPPLPKVFSRKWLAPVLGEDIAKQVASSLETIEVVARPRPGEPDTSSHFGSHVTNAIPIEQVALTKINELS